MIPKNLGEVGESVWIDVIRKMDEVYSELLQYEVALEQKNAELEETQQFLFSVLTSMSDILIVCDRKGAIQEVNRALVKLVGREAAALRGVCVLELLADKASRERAAQFIYHLHGEGLTDCELQFPGDRWHGDPGRCELDASLQHGGQGGGQGGGHGAGGAPGGGTQARLSSIAGSA
ncbi:PAS domain-containing protein [Pelomicrobium sp.]|uniref:PAS domain-containing protein n=1 Tax=Pelomicrobium sp. TaxID=2815319 RepID=UPI002FDEA81D